MVPSPEQQQHRHPRQPPKISAAHCFPVSKGGVSHVCSGPCRWKSVLAWRCEDCRHCRSSLALCVFCVPARTFALSLNLKVAPCPRSMHTPVCTHAVVPQVRSCLQIGPGRTYSCWRRLLKISLGMEFFRRCTDVFRYKTSREIADNCCR